MKKSFEEIKAIYEAHPFDIDTKAVEQGNPIQKRWHEIKFNAVVEEIKKANLKKGSKILDLACGSGGLTFKLAKRFPEYSFVGCDFNKHVIAYAESRAYEEKFKNIYFDCFPAEKLDYMPKIFDMVLGLDALDHFYDPEQALREMHRVLKENGTLALIVGNYESFWPVLEKLLDLFWKSSRDYTETHLTHFTMGSIGYMLYCSGFKEALWIKKLHLGMSLFCRTRKEAVNGLPSDRSKTSHQKL